MRLIDAETLELTTTIGDDPPPYAIVSHTWSDDEITLADYDNPSSRSSRAFEKVRSACSVARGLGLYYIWIDTCCIDKESSAELSEAINSMYQWYAQARHCIVYLADVTRNVIGARAFEAEFRKTRWFTRSWTLQELIAPQRLTFLSADWNVLGTRDELAALIASITRIPEACILQRHLARGSSVAQIFSWASGRRATRGEDRAYSLLGLLDVNIPLLYGEGAAKTFRRLQLEIIRESSDESIFAWRSGDALGLPDEVALSSMLAVSPESFSSSGDVVPASVYPFTDRAPYRYTNKGLEFEIRRLVSDAHDALSDPTHGRAGTQDSFVVPLNCRREGDANSVLALTFKRYPFLLSSSQLVVGRQHHSLDSIKLSAPEVQEVVSQRIMVAGWRQANKMREVGDPRSRAQGPGSSNRRVLSQEDASSQRVLSI